MVSSCEELTFPGSLASSELAHPDGEICIVKGAGSLRIPYAVSPAAIRDERGWEAAARRQKLTGPLLISHGHSRQRMPRSRTSTLLELRSLRKTCSSSCTSIESGGDRRSKSPKRSRWAIKRSS